MREILFKAKRKDNGEWVEGYLIKSFTGICYIVKLYDHILNILEKYEVDENTLCQFTDLTDKNGNKIWENDIICINDAEECVVRWRFGAFELLYRVCANSIYAYVGTDLYINDNTLDIKVLGNTIDNPELLDNKN